MNTMMARRYSSILLLFFGHRWLMMLHVCMLGGAVVSASAPPGLGSDLGSNPRHRNRRPHRRSGYQLNSTPDVIPGETIAAASTSGATMFPVVATSDKKEARPDEDSSTPSSASSRLDSHSHSHSNSHSNSMGSPESIRLKPRVVSLNIMVAGLAGLGKTTLCRALLDAWWRELQEERGDSAKTDTKKASGKGRLGFLSSSFVSSSSKAASSSTTTSYTTSTPSKPTISTTAISPSAPFEYFDEKANTILRVRIIDTPGFGNRVNHRNSVKPITDYISNCRRRRFRREQSPSSQGDDKNDDDANNRLLVHVCLYFLSPGRFLAIDKHFLNHVQDEVTIVPVIAKADTMTDDEIARYRAELTRIWESEAIGVYSLDERSKNNDQRNSVCFGSGSGTANELTTASSNNKFYRGRNPGEVLAIISRDGIYPWGHSCALDPEHSDLKLIRDSLLSEHTERFLELATSKYVAYRDARIAKQSRSETLKYVALVGLAAIQLGRVEIKGTTLRAVFVKGFSALDPILRRLKSAPKLLWWKQPRSNSDDSDAGNDNNDAAMENDGGGNHGVLAPANDNPKTGFRFGFFGKPSLDSNSNSNVGDREHEIERDNVVPEPAKSTIKPFPLGLFRN